MGAIKQHLEVFNTGCVCVVVETVDVEIEHVVVDEAFVIGGIDLKVDGGNKS